MSVRAQKTMQWIVMIIVTLVIAQQFLKPHSSTENTTQPEGQKPSIPTANNPGPQLTMDMLIPQIIYDIAIVEDIPGTGDPVTCGQSVSYTFKDSLPDGTLDKEGGGKPIVTIGMRNLASIGHEQGLIGMRKGGKRTIRMPYEWASSSHQNSDGNMPAYITAELELQNIFNTLPVTDFPLRRFENVTGIGQHIICGDRLKAQVKVWRADGSLLYATPQGFTETFTTGHAQVFFGLEQAVLGMRAGGHVTAIIPPAYFQPVPSTSKTPEARHPALGEIAENQLIIVDIAIPQDYKPGAE